MRNSSHNREFAADLVKLLGDTDPRDPGRLIAAKEFRLRYNNAQSILIAAIRDANRIKEGEAEWLNVSL